MMRVSFLTECLAKIHTDRRLIVKNINVTFHEEGKDSNKSWYAFVQWEPIGKESVFFVFFAGFVERCKIN